MNRIACTLLALAVAASALGQGSVHMIDVTDPPVATIPSATYDISSGVVTRQTGTFDWPDWMADGRIQVVGETDVYTVDTRDSDTQITLDNTGVNETGVALAFGAGASIPWDGNDDTASIASVFHFMQSTSNRATVYFPSSAGGDWGSASEFNDGYEVSETIEVRQQNGTRGMRIVGQGLGNNNGGPSEARLSWTGSGTGPLMAFQDCAGLVLDGLSFDGDGLAGVGDPIEKLVTIRNEDDTSVNFAFNLRISNCLFRDAPTLVEMGSFNDGGNANYLWDNCLFEGEHDGSDKAQYAIRFTHSQGVMHTFVQCEWRICNICLQVDTGGRIQVYGGGVGECWQFIRRNDAGKNTAGVSVRDLFTNSGDTARMVFYESEQAGTGRYWGPITFEGVHTGSAWPSVNFEEVSGYSGNTVTLAQSGQIDVRPGDQIAFYDVDDLDTPLGITNVTGRSSTQTYSVADTAVDLGITVDADLRAAHGTPLFKLTGGERLAARDCWFTRGAVRGKRLCRLETGSWVSGVQPLARFTMCSGLRADDPTQLASRYLWMDTSAGNQGYFRFSDCDDIQSLNPPMSFTNIPAHSVTSAPDANDDANIDDNVDDAIGYAVGAELVDTSNDKVYILVDATDGSASWIETTQAGGGGGGSLPVDDTTSIVQDPSDNSKEMRIDVGTVATSTTRVLSMPDANVDLVKNNTASGAPDADNDAGEGYAIGSRWFDINGLTEYVCISPANGAALWKETTSAGGGSLPVSDSTSVVEDNSDGTKEIRLEASSIATGTVRVLTMPDADVSLQRTNTATSDPGSTNDADEGYGVGSLWFNTNTDTAWVCLDNSDGAAVWTDITQSGGEGGEGDTLPVDDTTAIVQDPSDNTKRTRIDTGGVASGTTRILTMPDSDVALMKNNTVATVAPTVNDDASASYSVGSRWFDIAADKEYVCLDDANGEAVWVLSASFPGALPSDTPNLPASRIWEFARSGGVVGTNDRIVKDPQESITIAADFTDLLGPAETISSITSVTAASAINVTVSNDEIVGQYVQMEVSGGTNLRAAPVTMTIVTSSGDTIVAQGRLHIVD